MNRRTLLRRSGGALAAALTGTLAGALTGRLSAAPQDDRRCHTPSQTEGPFYPTREQTDTDLDLTRIDGRDAQAEGDVVWISGRVLDDRCEPVAGAVIDLWQANRHGRYSHESDPNPAPLDPNFQGWGRVLTDAEGRYRFKTIVPGAYPVQRWWWRPPHIHFKVARRGYRELTTQMYFAGHELNDKDRILMAVPAAERERLIVAFAADPAGPEPGLRHGRFDLVLQSA